MSDRRIIGETLRRAASTTAILALSIALVTSSAYAASVAAGPTTTLSDTFTGSTGVTYSFGTYRISNGEYCTGASLTFPAGTDVSGATASSPAGTVAVSGQTVTVTFTNRIRGRNLILVIGGIRNPQTPGLYNAGGITLFLTNPAGGVKPPETYPTGDYSIVTPTMSISITPETIDFGELLPGDAPPPQTVNVTVSSSTPVQLTRVVAGDVTDLGLTVSGTASGSKPAGTATYTDAYRVAPTWYSEAGVPLAASVNYTLTP